MGKYKKPKLLCLHGALGSAAQLQLALSPLADSYEIICFDFPGYGKLTDKSLTVNSCITATKNFILQNKLAGTTVLGYSMGGYIALLMARKYPELMGQIITLGTKLQWNLAIAEKEIKNLNPIKMRDKIPAYVAYLKKWHGDEWSTAVIQTAELIRSIGTVPLLYSDMYQSILHPVLLCLAEKDNLVTEEETLYAAHLLPFGDFASIPNSEHPIEKVDLQALNSAISNFISH